MAGDVGQRFVTTRWSMVVSAAERHSPAGRRAMDELCARYWYPLYVFIRRKGYGADEAEDITQGFLAQFIERDCVSSAQREKGRFRTFLLVCLRNYIANLHEARSAAKRGGGRPILSFDAADAESRYHMEPADERTPERLFARNWAIAVLESALARVEGDFVARSRQRIFEALKVYLTGDELAPAYAEVAKELAMSETAVKVAVHRLRQQYREAVEDEIRDTLDSHDDPVSIAREIDDLLEALSEARR